MYFSRLSALALASLVPAAYSLSIPRQPQGTNQSISWSPCNITGATGPVECGTLPVPLDYTDETCNNNSFLLHLQRIPATESPKQGSILFNFGGPGADGSLDLVAFADRLLASTGGSFDLINVVPRGTGGEAEPFSCYPSAESRTVGTTPQVAANASDAALGYIWARATVFAENCAAVQADAGALIGTAFVARDLMQVVDALGEDGLLRYWGVSYGTLLGATTAAMFPDRIDKMILDGVVNPFEYYQNREIELFTDADAAFKGFCKGCVEAPDACPLAANQTAEELEQTLFDFFELLKYEPIPVPNPVQLGGGQLLDYSRAKSNILSILYFPALWPALSVQMAGFMSRDPALMILPMAVTESESLYGIKCSDVLTHSDSLDDLLPVYHGRQNISRLAGDTAFEMPARCAQWKMPAKERYDGDFNVRTKNPLLVIGNTYDPVTPLASARNVSQTFEGSVLLQQDSYGHDSMMQASLCTAKAVRSYFTEGILPEADTKCSVDVPLFSGSDGWAEVIEQLNSDA